MILQALYEYYQRKASDPESHIAPEGWEWKPIPFVVAIDSKGKYLGLYDTRQPDGKKKVSKSYLVPRGIGRSGKDACELANLFWDHYGYVLGIPKDETVKSKEIAQKQLNAFTKRFHEFPDDIRKLPIVAAVLKFYELKEYQTISSEDIQDCLKVPGCNLVFSVDGNVLTDNPDIKKYVDSLIGHPNRDENDDGEIEPKEYEAICLITGQKGQIQRKHARTPINKDTKSFVAIQKNSGYDSYGKQQAFNCPVSPSAEFAYTTALNTLLRSGRNRVQVSDMSIVFWAQKKPRIIDLEEEIVWLFKSDKDNPERGIDAVKGLYNAVDSGRLPLEEDNQFYVLGLAPNAARISVRFWKTGTVSNFAKRIKQHFEDFKIKHYSAIEDDSEKHDYLSLNQILSATALQYKMENVPPNLAGDVILSILEGAPYPRTLFHQCIRRIRAEVAKKDANGRSRVNVNRARAAILKACINRFNRFYNKDEKEVLVGLDRTNTNTGYRIGRLFAVLEKIQEEASSGSLNTTIRDRFYGAASATPITVFPQLLKLKNHHMAKLHPGRKVNLEKEIQEIFDSIKSFPSHLTLDEQALFAVGYYHQRQYFFTKKDSDK